MRSRSRDLPADGRYVAERAASARRASLERGATHRKRSESAAALEVAAASLMANPLLLLASLCAGSPAERERAGRGERGFPQHDLQIRHRQHMRRRATATAAALGETGGHNWEGEDGVLHR